MCRNLYILMYISIILKGSAYIISKTVKLKFKFFWYKSFITKFVIHFIRLLLSSQLCSLYRALADQIWLEFHLRFYIICAISLRTKNKGCKLWLSSITAVKMHLGFFFGFCLGEWGSLWNNCVERKARENLFRMKDRERERWGRKEWRRKAKVFEGKITCRGTGLIFFWWLNNSVRILHTFGKFPIISSVLEISLLSTFEHDEFSTVFSSFSVSLSAFSVACVTKSYRTFGRKLFAISDSSLLVMFERRSRCSSRISVNLSISKLSFPELKPISIRPNSWLMAPYSVWIVSISHFESTNWFWVIERSFSSWWMWFSCSWFL